MEIKNVHMVIFSPCGGTENVIKAMGKDITLPKFEHNITLPGNRREELSFAKNDLVFFGFPVYGGHLPRNAAEIFGGFTGNETSAVLIAVYGNRAYEAALLDMHKLALERGFKPVAASAAVAEHSLAPMIAAGRPDAVDVKALAAFGLEAIERLKTGVSIVDVPGVQPNLSVPPNKDAFLIGANENCDSCGLCAQICPAGAITPVPEWGKDKLQLNDLELCILCAACIKYCPVKARDFVSQAFRKMGAEHLKNAVMRKEPEFF